MKLYLAMSQLAYEQPQYIGIYSSLGKAKEACEEDHAKANYGIRSYTNRTPLIWKDFEGQGSLAELNRDFSFNIDEFELDKHLE